jgi:predicted protein tyrosine phosphatase
MEAAQPTRGTVRRRSILRQSKVCTRSPRAAGLVRWAEADVTPRTKEGSVRLRAEQDPQRHRREDVRWFAAVSCSVAWHWDDARVKLTAGDLGWADVVFVMEKNHKNRIAKKFSEEVVGKKIVCLFIEDIYDPHEPALIEELRRRLAPRLLLPDSEEPNQSVTQRRGADAPQRG